MAKPTGLNYRDDMLGMSTNTVALPPGTGTIKLTMVQYNAIAYHFAPTRTDSDTVAAIQLGEQRVLKHLLENYVA